MPLNKRTREKKLRETADLLMESLLHSEDESVPEVIRKSSLKDRVSALLSMCEHLDVHEARNKSAQPFKIEFSREE